MDDQLIRAAAVLLDAFRAEGKRVVTAESCTGGLILAALTEVPGSSSVVDRGFVTYSNEAKAEMLGVPMQLIQAVGAVSAEVAHHMAAGALTRSRADVAVSVTGVAGPGGGSADKPVGLVWFGLAVRGKEARTRRKVFDGDRAAIRHASVLHALALLTLELATASEQ